MATPATETDFKRHRLTSRGHVGKDNEKDNDKNADKNADKNDKNDDTVVDTLAKVCHKNGVLTARVAELEQEVADHKKAFAFLAKVAKEYAKRVTVMERLLAAAAPTAPAVPVTAAVAAPVNRGVS